MPFLANHQTFNCLTSYVVETIGDDNVQAIRPFFDRLPVDPYFEEGFRFRRFSHFSIKGNTITQLPHTIFFQSKAYNPHLGDVYREYEDIDPALAHHSAFRHAILNFFDFCQLCSSFDTVGVHQIRVTTSIQKQRSPAPEGIHQDGVDLVGILCIDRHNLAGGVTHLYPGQNDDPIMKKILYPGELLVFNDHQFFHFTTAIRPAIADQGHRDVFVFTCPDMPFNPNERLAELN